MTATKHPCRIMETRTCPQSYGAACGERPCARFESDDETPWHAEPRLARPAEGEIPS